MPRFRQIIEVEAVRWDGRLETLYELKPDLREWSLDPHTRVLTLRTAAKLRVHVNLGDWIIRGLSGELYACKPKAFDRIFQPVVNDAA